MEVETDKAVMEVEAQADGFLSDVSAGENVPVGNIIAVITAEKQSESAQAPTAAQSAVAVEPPAAAMAEPIAMVQPETAVGPVVDPTGRILASPKARRLAHEQGLDLAQLVQAGMPQPYHVADLEQFRHLPSGMTGSKSQMSAQATLIHITARVQMFGATQFLQRMREEAGISIKPSTLWVRFAAAALRSVAPPSGALVVELVTLGGDKSQLRDPDHTRLSVASADADGAPTSLILQDLTGSAITSMRLADQTLPTIGIGADGDCYFLTFDVPQLTLSDDAAIEFVTAFADRLENPLEYLV